MRHSRSFCRQMTKTVNGIEGCINFAWQLEVRHVADERCTVVAESVKAIVAVVDGSGIQIVAADSITRIGQFNQQSSCSAGRFKDSRDRTWTMLFKAGLEEIEFCCR